MENSRRSTDSTLDGAPGVNYPVTAGNEKKAHNALESTKPEHDAEHTIQARSGHKACEYTIARGGPS